MIVPTCAASSTCGICASIGLVRSCTINCIPCALAQQALKRAPVCVLHVFSATPVQPSSRPNLTSLTEQLKARAQQQNIPIVGVSETMPLGAQTFQGWQASELQ